MNFKVSNDVIMAIYGVAVVEAAVVGVLVMTIDGQVKADHGDEE